jgi:hypothetical protein
LAILVSSVANPNRCYSTMIWLLIPNIRLKRLPERAL